MTAEQYAANGFYYSDYLRMSQWQRFRNICRIFKSRRLRNISLYLHLQVWPLKGWRLGFDSSQEYEHLYIGPLCVGLSI